jgi:predicted ArsR family transcriptional regulator
MELARDELVRILDERGDSSVAVLADTMGMSQGSVRRHLDILGADGLIEARQERRPRGRPLTLYSLSEAGEERSSSASYARLLDHVYPALTELDAGDVDGRSGAAILWRVFESVAERVASDRAPFVRSDGLPDRITEVVAALSEVGVLHDAVDEGDAFRLSNVGCPCRSTAQETNAACEADRYSIELLVGAPVEQVATIAGGSSCCEYIVKKPADGDTDRGASVPAFGMPGVQPPGRARVELL